VKRALIVAIAILPGLAEAGHGGHGCREISDIVGRERCTRFGLWSRDASAWGEAGPIAVHLHSGRTGTGAGGRVLIGFWPALYLGMQLEAAHLDDASTTMPAGGLVSGGPLVGARVRFGSITLSTEAEAALRGFGATASGVFSQPALTTPDSGFVVLARPEVALWLTPSISLAVAGGIDVVHPDDVTVGVMLGIHTWPYDLARTW